MTTEKISPVRLKPVPDKSMNAAASGNLIIDGDNLPVMQSLLPEYRGKISVIYMDPPYNTGSDTFAYDDSMFLSKEEVREARRQAGRSETVGLDDPNRHSKWVNHMASRLWAAKKLLAPSGIIIISIDEHEQARLHLLMEEIFGEKNRIATLVWERSHPKNDTKYISEGHEYILLWARDLSVGDALCTQDGKGKWRERKPGSEMLKAECDRLGALHGADYSAISAGLKAFCRENGLKGLAAYTHVDHRFYTHGPYAENPLDSASGASRPRYEVLHPTMQKAVRVPTRGWGQTQEVMDQYLSDDMVVWKSERGGKEPLGTPRLKAYLLAGREEGVMRSVVQKYGTNAVNRCKNLLGGADIFAFPKDHDLLARLFNLVSWRNPNAIILDPYAGSGTTADAVIKMNAEDNGNRRFILIEGGFVGKNSKVKQADYTDQITAERVRRVVTGVWADGKPHPSYDTGFTFMKAEVMQ